MLREDSLAEMLGQERNQMAEGPGSLSGCLPCRNLEIWNCAFSHLINQCLLSDEGPQGEGTQALNINDQSVCAYHVLGLVLRALYILLHLHTAN